MNFSTMESPLVIFRAVAFLMTKAKKKKTEIYLLSQVARKRFPSLIGNIPVISENTRQINKINYNT